MYLELAGRSFEKGSEVGFNKEEIIKTSTEDLLALRKSVLLYIKSKKLKKRNANFKDVYQRINQELNERKHLTKKEEESINQGFVKVVHTESRRSMSTSELTSAKEDSLVEAQHFLKRKHSLAIEVEIPSFFNDKKQRVEPKPKDEPQKPPEKACLNGN